MDIQLRESKRLIDIGDSDNIEDVLWYIYAKYCWFDGKYKKLTPYELAEIVEKFNLIRR